MSNIVCNYPLVDYENLMIDFLKDNKAEDFRLEDIKGIFYTDGGSRTIDRVNHGGWGVHGYLYIDKDTNSNSGCKKAVPTREKGYISGKIGEKDNKAFVTAYVDYYGSLLTNSTNNKAEMLGMLRCLYLVKQLALKHTVIYADSKYVLGLIENRDKYVENNFKKSDGKELANVELCKSLFELYEEVSEELDIEVKWVKGHNGEYGNEMADRNATRGCYVASNHHRNVVIKTDKDVEDDYRLDGMFFNIETPDDYFGKELEGPKMLSENSLFFTTNGIDIRDNTTYYQASFGKMLNSKDKEERKGLRGKPFADCCVSVIELKEPDPVINNLINIVADNFPNTGVIECNLTYQMRQGVYSDLLKGGLNAVSVDINKGRVLLPNKEELASLTNPVRQTFKLISDFNAVKDFLDRYTKRNMSGIDSATDITPYLYESKETKKKTTLKVIDHESGAVTVPVDLNVNGTKKTTHIPITIGVDTPSKVSLGRMKTIEPKVTLLTWETTERTVRFATLIESTEGVGLWMGIYSNIHLH